MSRLREYYPDLASAPGNRYKMSKVKNLYEGLADYTKREDDTTEAGWAALAHQLDDYHKRKRAEAVESDSKKPFTHIRILESSDRKRYGSGSVEAALNELLQMDEFTPNTVLLMGFGLVVDGKSEGHAVAVFRKEAQTYFLLDPNYGVFKYVTLSGVFTALMYLFGNLGQGSGSPVYDSKPGWQVTGAVSYILFAHA